MMVVGAYLKVYLMLGNIHRVPKKGSHQTFGNNFLKS